MSRRSAKRLLAGGVLVVEVILVVVLAAHLPLAVRGLGHPAQAAATPPGTSTPAAPATVPTPAPTPSSTVPAPAPAAPQGTVYRCTTNELRLSLGQTQGGGGQSSQAYLLTNTTSHSCGLVGYPGMQMQDSQGTALPTTAVRMGTEGPTVILAPGAVASFQAIWQNGFGYATPPPSCAFPARMAVIPPNAFTQLAVGVQGMEVCGNGRIEVTTVVAGSNP